MQARKAIRSIWVSGAVKQDDIDLLIICQDGKARKHNCQGRVYVLGAIEEKGKDFAALVADAKKRFKYVQVRTELRKRGGGQI